MLQILRARARAPGSVRVSSATASLPLEIVCRREANADEVLDGRKLGTKLFRPGESLLKHTICERRMRETEIRMSAPFPATISNSNPIKASKCPIDEINSNTSGTTEEIQAEKNNVYYLLCITRKFGGT